MNYSTLRQDLLTSGQPNFFTAANLPAGNSINGVTNFWVSSSVGAIFGLFTQAADGFVAIGTQFTPGAQRVSAFLHEFGHAMGRVPETINGAASALDLWRFTNPGVRLFNGANPNNTPAYFSLDGGATKLADWGETSDVSDFLNNALTGNDPFNEFVGNLGHLTNLDILITEALGYTHPTPNPPPPPGTTADMVLRHGADGIYEIYDIGDNAILAAFPLGQVGTDWQFVTLGGFFGNDTTDMLLRNANTGGFEVYDISNNNDHRRRLPRQCRARLAGHGFRQFLELRRNRHDPAQRQQRRIAGLRHQEQSDHRHQLHGRGGARLAGRRLRQFFQPRHQRHDPAQRQ